MMPLILASSSPRRFEILSRLNIPFTVVPADVAEDTGERMLPDAMVRHNARLKGDFVAGRFPDRVVLAADTTVFLDGKILNKPADLDEAWRMLKALSSRTHTVFTGIYVKGPAGPGEYETAVESRVTFRELDDAVIARYFQLVNPLDKAGAYGIQTGRELIIEKFDGSLTNIMGLPEEETREALKKFGL